MAPPPQLVRGGVGCGLVLFPRSARADSFLRVVRRRVRTEEQGGLVRGNGVAMLHPSRDADIIAFAKCRLHVARAHLHLAADDVQAVLGIRMDVFADFSAHLDQVGSRRGRLVQTPQMAGTIPWLARH